MSACALALVLLLDASASILPPEWRLQTQGHAAAFEDPAVHRAIARGEGVAVTALSFSDHAREMVGWRILRDGTDAAGFAEALREAPRGLPSGTDVGGALLVAMDRLEAAPCAAEQQVIDLATDGEANERRAQAARARAEERGVRINAIGVASAQAGDWLRENAVTPGGFVMEAPDWPSFAVAIRRKVTLELAGDP
jgi:Ca-activated chloride channel family protein